MPHLANPPPSSTSFPRRLYLPRVIGLALGALCVGSALPASLQTAVWVWLLFLVNALLWPHMAYLLASRSANPRAAEKNNLLIDSLLGGFWVVAMQGALLPSVLIIAMLSMNNVATGGFRFLRKGLLAHLIGAMLGWGILGWHFQPESAVIVQIASIPLLLIYPLLIGAVTFRLAHQLHQQRTELRWLSEHDTLSGIYNRRFFERRIAQEFENFKRHSPQVALAVADIDHFKNINDSYGHAVGDSVIRATGQVFSQQVRLSDVVARIGGDEFVVLMPFTSTSEAHQLIQRLQIAFLRAIADDPRLAGISLSFGIAAPQPDMQSHEQWFELADRALYSAKACERGSVKIAGIESPSA